MIPDYWTLIVVTLLWPLTLAVA